MVHGVCSSAGCFSMTDEQIADIYAIARDSFRGGQREIQLQSYPFHMTAENLAKFRLDPNIDFWKEIKNGSDHFEVTKTEPPVLVCGKHYVFGATASGDVSATGPCPALKRDETVESEVAEKAGKDDAKVAELVASGVKPIRLVYQDGGQNPAYAGYKDSSDPEALASGPQEIVLEQPAKATPAAVKVASADAAKSRVQPASAPMQQAAAASAPAPVALASASAGQSSGGILGGWGVGAQNVKKWLHLSGQEPTPPPVAAFVPEQPIPSDAPLPPRRAESDAPREKDLRLASLHTQPKPPAKPSGPEPASDKPKPSEATAPAALPTQ